MTPNEKPSNDIETRFEKFLDIEGDLFAYLDTLPTDKERLDRINDLIKSFEFDREVILRSIEPKHIENEMLRKGDFLLIAIRNDDDEVHQDIAFSTITRIGMRTWLSEQTELRGIERNYEQKH